MMKLLTSLIKNKDMVSVKASKKAGDAGLIYIPTKSADPA